MRVTGREEGLPEPRRIGERRSFEESLERAGVQPQPSALRPAVPALPELREAVRAVPVAIWAGRVGGGATVELAFGGGLSVELRQAVGGVELAIRAVPALVRAAQVDLPALVRLLAERGVAVVRAEVRSRPSAGGTAGGAASR